MNGNHENEDPAQPLAFLPQKLEAATTPEERMEIIWKAILVRLPKESEKALVSHRQEDLIWALLNSNEFRFAK